MAVPVLSFKALGDTMLLDRETITLLGVGARRTNTATGDKRVEHARNIAGRATHGAICALLLDQVEGLRLQVLWQYQRV